jgi:PEGA domain
VIFRRSHRAFERVWCSPLWLLALVMCALEVGCVQRRLTIRSNPPGALVYVDDYQVGTTPVSTDFVYYGTRKVRLVKSGYETLSVLQPIPTPWYEYPAMDFVSENLIPGEIRDERVVDYQLQPQIVVPSPQLLDRAENLRHGASGPPLAAPPAGPTYGPPTEARPGPPSSPPPVTRPGSPFNY